MIRLAAVVANVASLALALPARSPVARLVLGVQFDLTDVLWYPAGVVPLAAAHWILLRNGSRTAG